MVVNMVLKTVPDWPIQPGTGTKSDSVLSKNGKYQKIQKN